MAMYDAAITSLYAHLAGDSDGDMAGINRDDMQKACDHLVVMRERHRQKLMRRQRADRKREGAS